MNTDPTPELDKRFSDPEAVPTPWAVTATALERAELYWITTVRPDGRPHVTPLVGVADDGAVYFCTGLEEQKARNVKQQHGDGVGDNERVGVHLTLDVAQGVVIELQLL